MASEADTLRADLKALRAALEEAEDVLALMERPSFIDPQYGEEVEALGMRIGFGALMASASASWRLYLIAKGDPPGSEHTSGPCHASVIRALEIVRQALQNTEAA